MKKGIRLISYNILHSIFVKLTKQVFLVFIFCMVVFFQTPSVMGDLPVTGYPVPELAPFFCEGDELFFCEDLAGVEFERPHTIATGAKDCPFSLRWTQDEEELP